MAIDRNIVKTIEETSRRPFMDVAGIGTLTLKNGSIYSKDHVESVARALVTLSNIAYPQADEPNMPDMRARLNAHGLLTSLANGSTITDNLLYGDKALDGVVKKLLFTGQSTTAHTVRIAQDMLVKNAQGKYVMDTTHLQKQIEADAEQLGLKADAAFYPNSVRVSPAPASRI